MILIALGLSVFLSLLNNLSEFVLNFLAIVLAIIFIVDTIVSFIIISGINSVNFGKSKDTTDEVTERVRAILKEKSILSRRLINAFPDLKVKLKIKKWYIGV